METFKVPAGFFESLVNETPLTDVEGYYLTGFYTNYFIATGKFKPLVRKCEIIDLIHDIYGKFIKQDFFKKYNHAMTSKKYHVMLSVKRSLIDKIRRHREEISLNLPVGDPEEGCEIMDLMPDPQSAKPDDESRYQELFSSLLDLVPDTTDSRLRGQSRWDGEVNFSPRVIIRHVERGCTPAEIAAMFINPRSGRPVSTSHVSQIIAEVRILLSEKRDELVSAC